MAPRTATIDAAYFAAEREADLNVIGSSAQRADARGHVTGQTMYFEDVSYPGMTHLKMHRSSRHHALITHVDVAPALAVPGVLRVLTWRDVPNNWYTILRLIGVQPDDEPVLAEDRVLYMGEPVCAVVATTEGAAIEGASRVVVEYEDLPAVFDVEEALRPDAPLVNLRHGHNYFTYEGHHCRRIRFGDVAQGFAESDHIFEHTYQSSPIEHAPLETTGCIVKPEGDGRLKIHSDTQACYFTLDNTALTLGIPFNRLRVVGGTVGGGFGGKVDVMVEPIACIAAQAVQRPVKYVYSRAEEMQVSSPRAAERLDRQRRRQRRRPHRGAAGDPLRRCRRLFPAQSVRNDQGRRAHAGAVHDPQRLGGRSLCLHQPHAIQRHAGLRRDYRRLRAGEPDGPRGEGARHRSARIPAQERLPRWRHEGASQDCRRGGADRGDAARGGAGRPSTAGGVPGAVVAAWEGTLMTRLRGRGFAAVNYPTGMNLGGDPSQALIHATTTGSFVITLSSVDLGQGLKTVIAQCAAEALGLPLEMILVDTADTDTGPHCMGTFASRGTHRVGNAVIMAAREARETMLEVAADELEVAAVDLETDGSGFISVKGSSEQKIRVTDVALAAHFKYGKTVSGRGIYLKPKSEIVPETGEMDPDSCHAHACTVAEVEVDDETGMVEVLKLSSVYEMGRALNPAMAQQQIVGGGWMGIVACALRDDRAVLPEPRARPGRLQRVSDAGAGRSGGDGERHPGAAGGERSLRRQGDRRDDGELAHPGHRQRHLRRLWRARGIAAHHAGEGAARSRRVAKSR